MASIPIASVVDQIEKRNQAIAKFWSKSHGWAPKSAAGLLSKSRLDWQVSLSGSLRHWTNDPIIALTPGDLILAWANLGSLIEGSLKTLLSVYYEDYIVDTVNLKKSGAYHNKKDVPLDPDGLTLGPLRKYCQSRKLLDDEGDALVELVHQRRNAIHAFEDTSIGNSQEFEIAVRRYFSLLMKIDSSLPYPNFR